MRRRDPKSGFTILDTMVAALVMLVGTVGLLSMQLVQLAAGARARELTEASQLLQQKLEELRLQPVPAAPVDGPVEALDARGCPVGAAEPPACAVPYAGTFYRRSYRIVPQGPDAAQVQVTVEWQDESGKNHALGIRHGQ